MSICVLHLIFKRVWTLLYDQARRTSSGIASGSGKRKQPLLRRFNVNQITTISRWETGELAIEGIALVAVEYVLAELARQASRRVA